MKQQKEAPGVGSVTRDGGTEGGYMTYAHDVLLLVKSEFLRFLEWHGGSACSQCAGTSEQPLSLLPSHTHTCKHCPQSKNTISVFFTALGPKSWQLQSLMTQLLTTAEVLCKLVKAFGPLLSKNIGYFTTWRREKTLIRKEGGRVSSCFTI